MTESLRVYATTPESEPQHLKLRNDPNERAPSGPEYRQQVVDTARWAEQAGCTGTLIYTNNTLVDPWSVAQLILDSTERLIPLVAVQPVRQWVVTFPWPLRLLFAAQPKWLSQVLGVVTRALSSGILKRAGV